MGHFFPNAQHCCISPFPRISRGADTADKTPIVCFEKKTSQPCATNLCQPVPTPLDTQCAITAPVTHAVTACDASVQCGL
eukprot:1215889-Prymnesium_polylepis.1